MQRIEAQTEEDRKTARSALTWVANAKRPLTISEITVALSIEPGARQLDEDNILDIDIILVVCAGLVIVDEQRSVVRLVHYTAQEYFDNIQAERFPDAQTDITRTLLTLLAFDGFPDPSWHSRNPPPLIAYSEYCLVHAAGQPEGPLRDMIVEFLGHAHRWKGTMLQSWRTSPWNSTNWPSTPSALWLAAAANLLSTARFLLEAAPMNKRPDGSGIVVASYYGHLEMVQLLAHTGAEVNTPIREHGTPLAVAIEAGHDTIVRLLLENGADPNARSGRYSFALHAALAEKQEKIAQLLIDNGADVNLQDERGGTGLTMALWYSMENIVIQLLERGADVNACGGQYGFALHTALANKHEKIARLLVENGADVDLQGELGGALTMASWYGMENIVVLLLERGADINVRGGLYGFALHTALASGHEEISRTLIDNGADVNLQARHGGAVTTASWYGMEKTVLLLLERGVAVNARGGRCEFALHAALTNGHIKIARILIENGANVNLLGLFGTALTFASRHGIKSIALLLLERGADVNACGGEHGCALYTALAQKQEKIAQLLIENGADVNALYENLYCPLELAADWGNEDLVRRLINKGADPNAHDGVALLRASRDGHENIVQFLLDNGADVNLQNKKYGCALLAAFDGGHRAIVQLLLKHGAKVNWPDMTGDSSESEQRECESTDEEESTGAGYCTVL
ncbi:Ankyrin repeat domain-containing protein [Mycena venus]|uniref:Ankyrin repeat domain-containing protein n=1 Tax=Mycena venus TaxID=2733690 RepID=A0A8H7CRE9_9AGAR|nr:Ankyrin repeat domain-containing protein [Mycena venus]